MAPVPLPVSCLCCTHRAEWWSPKTCPHPSPQNLQKSSYGKGVTELTVRGGAYPGSPQWAWKASKRGRGRVSGCDVATEQRLRDVGTSQGFGHSGKGPALEAPGGARPCPPGFPPSDLQMVSKWTPVVLRPQFMSFVTATLLPWVSWGPVSPVLTRSAKTGDQTNLSGHHVSLEPPLLSLDSLSLPPPPCTPCSACACPRHPTRSGLFSPPCWGGHLPQAQSSEPRCSLHCLCGGSCGP